MKKFLSVVFLGFLTAFSGFADEQCGKFEQLSCEWVEVPGPIGGFWSCCCEPQYDYPMVNQVVKGLNKKTIKPVDAEPKPTKDTASKENYLTLLK